MHRQSMPSAAILAALAVFACPASAAVTGSSLKASPAVYRGNCPGTVTFNGSITSNSAGAVRYTFTRSDGATSPTRTLLFRRAGTLKVSTTWTLGGPYFAGWQGLRILSVPGLRDKRANFELKCNPPLNTALGAHGNTDWHIDTANEFLFGTDMAGSLTAPNHAPNAWTKRHIHVGLTNTAKFYNDKTKIASGDDTHATSGIDNAMLFFYAGHGSPTSWDTLGDGGSQSNMLMANIVQGGTLRYYLQCSCDVFAHGPRSCAGGGMDYSCPQNFAGGADSAASRNVFERWGPALTPDLRLACGMSTLAYCHEGNVNKFWDNYNNGGMGVATAFIDGFDDWGVVPLCITTGGANIATTPLYDAHFTNQPNAAGNTHYHIRFAAGTGSAMKPLDIHWIPLEMIRYKVEAAEIHPRLRSVTPEKTVALRAFAGGNAKLRSETASGAVYLQAAAVPPPTSTAIDPREFPQRAASLLRELNWQDGEVGEPVVTQIATASMPIGGSAADIKQAQEGALVTYRRQIDVRGKRIDVLGEGGVMKVHLDNAGSVVAATRVWRKLTPTAVVVKIKPFEEARSEATAKLAKADAYKLDQWKFGYKEAAGNVRQEELPVVYQFAFVPKDRDDAMNTPPRIVEISAEKR
ncbi:MAG: hypothetical protein WBP72_04265 [Rhodocyclaceae bacterium]